MQNAEHIAATIAKRQQEGQPLTETEPALLHFSRHNQRLSQEKKQLICDLEIVMDYVNEAVPNNPFYTNKFPGIAMRLASGLLNRMQ